MLNILYINCTEPSRLHLLSTPSSMSSVQCSELLNFTMIFIARPQLGKQSCKECSLNMGIAMRKLDPGDLGLKAIRFWNPIWDPYLGPLWTHLDLLRPNCPSWSHLVPFGKV